MFAEKIRQAVEAAPRERLSDLSRALWKAFAAGAVTEEEANSLSVLIASRQLIQAVNKGGQVGRIANSVVGGAAFPARRLGSRPRTSESLERRRRWAASGRMPPQIASRFTLAEQAVLAVVALEASKRGDCRLALDHIAALAGVSRTTVRNAMKQARALGFVTVTERRVSTFRNQPNIVAIVSREWLAWMRLARRDTPPGGGRKSVTGTNTGLQDKGRQRPSDRSKDAAGGQGQARAAASQDSVAGSSRRADAMS
jgi:hypothetical protein